MNHQKNERFSGGEENAIGKKNVGRVIYNCEPIQLIRLFVREGFIKG